MQGIRNLCQKDHFIPSQWIVVNFKSADGKVNFIQLETVEGLETEDRRGQDCFIMCGSGTQLPVPKYPQVLFGPSVIQLEI